VLKTLSPALAVTSIATAAIAPVGPPTSQRPCSANRQLVLGIRLEFGGGLDPDNIADLSAWEPF